MESSLFQYRNGAETASDLEKVIAESASKMLPISDIDPHLFLLAVSQIETSLMSDNVARHEGAYDREGFYGLRSSALKTDLHLFGALAACSYGPWQILYITAKEHGFNGHPIELWKASVSIEYVIRFFNEKISQGAQSVEDLADSWNSGSFRDENKPLGYMGSVRLAYEHLLSKAN